MNSLAAPKLAPRVAAIADARLWHAGWAVGMVACAAALMAVFGALTPSVMAALVLAGAPGVLGWFWRPEGDKRYGLLAVWAIAMTLAATVSGGATGPLAAWCVAPLLVGVLAAATTPGLIFAGGSIVLAALLEWAGVAPDPAAGAEGVALTSVGFIIAFGSVAGAIFLVLRDAAARELARESEMAWFEEALSVMPYLGAAVDKTGVPEAVFGKAPQGLDTAALAEGLVETALPADRAAVSAALCEALDHGVGEAVYRASSDPNLYLRLAVARRGDEGLSVLLSPAAPLPTPLPVDSRIEALEARLAQAQVALAEAESARSRAEASAAAKSRFLANMSHELRTPLNAVMGFSDMMRARMFGEMAPKYGEYAEMIHESGRHLLDLINDVLDMSKIEADRYALERETFDAREAIASALRLVRLQADEAGVQMRALMPATALTVLADKRAVKQIVLNLVSNAVKFTPPGGSVTISADARDDILEIVVSDTGPGIAPEDVERLGQPFEQAGDIGQRSQGTGLGLSLVKALAGLHGGLMHIESAVGEGAAVTVRLPVIHSAPELPFPAPVAIEPVEAAAGPPATEKADDPAEAPPLLAQPADAAPVTDTPDAAAPQTTPAEDEDDSAASEGEDEAWTVQWSPPPTLAEPPRLGGTVIQLPVSRP